MLVYLFELLIAYKKNPQKMYYFPYHKLKSWKWLKVILEKKILMYGGIFLCVYIFATKVFRGCSQTDRQKVEKNVQKCLRKEWGLILKIAVWQVGLPNKHSHSNTLVSKHLQVLLKKEINISIQWISLSSRTWHLPTVPKLPVTGLLTMISLITWLASLTWTQ